MKKRHVQIWYSPDWNSIWIVVDGGIDSYINLSCFGTVKFTIVKGSPWRVLYNDELLDDYWEEYK